MSYCDGNSVVSESLSSVSFLNLGLIMFLSGDFNEILMVQVGLPVQMSDVVCPSDVRAFHDHLCSLRQSHHLVDNDKKTRTNFIVPFKNGISNCIVPLRCHEVSWFICRSYLRC